MACGDELARAVLAHAERGQLHADVRVEMLALDRVEHLEVRARNRASLVGVRDLLAEDVDRRDVTSARA